MKRLINWLNIILKKRKELKRWKRIVTALAAVITFATTYALILPAITVERDNTDVVAGMYLDREEEQDDLLTENALEPVGFRIAADQENAVTFAYTDDDMTATAIFSTDEEIPAEAELVVNPVDRESEEYGALSSRATDLLDKEFIYDITTCSFYDFALICEGVDVTPDTGLVDVQIYFLNNTVEHAEDVVYAGRFGRAAEAEEGLVAMSADVTDETSDTFADVEADNDLTESGEISAAEDELVSVNADESSVIELTDGIITAVSLKGSDLARSDSIIGILAGNVDEEARAAAAETDAEIPDYDVSQEEEAIADSVEADGADAPPVKTLKATGDDYTVVLTYDESAKISEGAYLTASEIAQDSKEYKTYLEETKKAMGLTEEETLPNFAARFFDIKIMVGDEEFTPKTGVSVEITYTEPLAENPETEVSAVHFADEAAEAEVIDANASEVKDDGATTVEFMAESFSVYGVIYTVDFHYTVDGEEYSYSIKGGSYVSLKDLVVITGLYDQEPYSKGESDDVNDSGEEEDIEAVTKAEQFIEHVAKVEFSNTDYVAVVHPGEDTTVGALKQSLGLECVYSEDVTEEEIAEIDAEAVRAGEWGMISLKPFESEETLTITMDNGDVCIVRVTDAQENPYGLGGKSFVVVNYRKTTTYDRIGNSWNGTYAEDTSRWVVHNNTPYYVVGNSGAIISTTSYYNQPKWTFTYLEEDRQFLMKDQNGNYLYIDDSSRQLGTTRDEETAKAHPFVATMDFDIKDEHPFTRVDGTNNDRKTHAEREYIFTNAAGTLALARTGNGYIYSPYGFGVANVNYDSARQWFALVNSDQNGTPGEIATADNAVDNIKVTLFDYGPDDLDHVNSAWENNNNQGDGKLGAMASGYNIGINANHGLKFTSHGTDYSDNNHISINSFSTNGYPGGSTQNVGYRAVQGIVQSELDDNGYPVLAPTVFNDESLDYLFNSDEIKEGNTYYKRVYENANHLFVKDEMGYYRYDSNKNYAYYDKTTGNFKVYASTFNEEGTGEQEGIGFFPFDDYNSNYNCIHGIGDGFKGWAPHSGTDALNQAQKAKTGHYNHHFGMLLETNFIMTPDGKYLGDDISFDFSGDDDLWVFVDGVLVLDIGGIHSPVGGNINFNTGLVTVGSREEGHTSDSDGQLVVKYGNSYEGQPGPASIKEAFSRVTGKEWDDSPYTRHSLKVFYLERGGMYSNLAISFNMPTYKTITVEKEVEGLTEAQLERYNDEYFYYQVKIKGSTGNALVPYDDIYGVLTRPATEDELEDWVKEYTTVDGKQVYVGGHWKEETNHGNTETINKDDEIVRWHIRVHNGIIRIKPGWKFTIEELGLNDQFTIAELYGYDPSYVFEDGEEDDPQTEDLMEDFFAPTAWYSYTEDLKDPTAIEFYDKEEPLELTEVSTPAPKAWISGTKDLQYSDHILFTNTMPTKLEVEKVWTDSETVNHSEDEITYKLYRIPYRIVENPDYDPAYDPAEIPGDNPDEPLHPEKLSKTKRVPQPIQEVRPVDETHHEEDSTVDTAYVSMDGFTGTLPIIDSSNNTISWKETISNLPTVGWYLHEDDQNRIRVLYDYHVSEVSATEGYKHSITGGLITGDESQAEHEGEYEYTITNEPVSPIDKFTDIVIEKEWLDAEGNREDGLDLHKDDTITFELTQKKYQAMAAVDAGSGQKENKVLYPITINLYDEDGNPDNDRVKDTVVVYVPEGASFTIEPLYNNSSDSNHVVAVGGTDIEVDPNSNTSTATWQYNKPDPPYPPSNIYYYSGVRFNIDNVDSAKEVTLWLHAGHDEWVYLYDDYDPDGSPYDRINYLNKDEEPGDHPEPHYHAWTCQLYCSDKVIWDLEEVYYHIVEQEDAYVIDNDNKPVVTDPKPKYEMKLKKNDDDEYTTQILPEINAPGSGGLTDPAQIWKGSITDLPLYELIEKDDTVETYIYTYEIVEKTIGSDGVVVAPVHGTETTGGEPAPVLYNGETSQYLVKWEEQTDGTLKFTNKKKETTEVSATKAWVNPDGEPMVPPQNATVTFALFADGETTGKTVVLDGTTVQSQIEAQRAEQIEAINASEMTPEEKAEAIAVAEAEAEAALAAWTYGELTTAWKAEWKDLPKYKYVVKDETPEDSSGEPSGDTTDDTPDDTEAEPIKEPVEIVYTVKETVTYPGYVEVDPDENYVEVDPDTFSVTNGGTITNKQLKYSLKIVKVDANNTETGLSGAKFQLTRKLPGESGFTKFEHDSFEVDSTNANKRTGPFTVSSTEGIILEGLIPGDYQIEEKTAPNGYIITLEPFTVTLNGDGTVTPSDTSGVLVVPLPKDNNNPAGLQIGNEPGAALPSTGGHGTRLFTILGSILIAGASLLLLRRRRTI